MTRQLKIVNAGTAFGKWLRNKLRDSSTGLAIMDIDTIIYVLDYFHEDENKLLLIEEKANGDQLTYSQGKTLAKLNQIIRRGAPLESVRYKGIYTIRMDGSDPTNSKSILVNGKSVSESQLIEMLNIGEIDG